MQKRTPTKKSFVKHKTHTFIAMPRKRSLVDRLFKKAAARKRGNTPSKRSNRWLVALVTAYILVALVLYVVTLRGVMGTPTPQTIKTSLQSATKPFELSPERGRYAHVVSLVEHGQYPLSQELAGIVYPDVGIHNGKFYSFFAPGISYLSVPFYIIGKYLSVTQVATYSISIVFALGNFLLLYKIGRAVFRLPLFAALVAPLVFAFASTSWSYAITLYQHQATTFLLLLSFFAVSQYAQDRKLYLWGCIIWLSYALAIFIDYPNAALFLPIIVYFAICSFQLTTLKKKAVLLIKPAIGITAIVFVAFTAFHLYHNYREFGDVRKVSNTITSYKDIVEQEAHKRAGKSESTKPQIEEKYAVKFFQEENLPKGLYTLLVAPDKGILVFSPIFALGFLGLLLLRKGGADHDHASPQPDPRQLFPL